jgi:hypothetical protein
MTVIIDRDAIIMNSYAQADLLETLDRLEQLEAAVLCHRLTAMQPGYEPSDAELSLWDAVRRVQA